MLPIYNFDPKFIIPCTSCNACTGLCWQKIAIPDYFRIYNEYVKDNKRKKELQKEYTEIAKTHGKASDCIMCRGCDGVCKDHLPTTYLRWVASVFK